MGWFLWGIALVWVCVEWVLERVEDCLDRFKTGV